jgi:hypothetical protein
MNYEQLKKHVIIVKSRLDDELELQSAHLLNCIDEVALAIAKRDEAKEALQRVDSEIASELRAGEDKISESKIVTMLPLDERHIRAYRLLGAAKLEADRWTGMQEVFRQRGSMLKVLVDLYLSGYFANDNATGNESRVQTIRAEEGRAALSAVRKPILARR